MPEPSIEAPARVRTRTCANCSAPLGGRFCARCGQEDRAFDLPFRDVVGAFAMEAFDWDSRAARTLRALLARPGRLTRQWIAGRRVHYLHPVRVYLIASFLFLLSVTLAGSWIQVRVSGPGMGPDSAQQVWPALHGTVLEPLAHRFEDGLRRAEADTGWLRERWFRSFAWTMFVAMPLFALLLGLVELRTRRPYLHHLVFAVHFHAFAFLMLAALILLWQLTVVDSSAGPVRRPAAIAAGLLLLAAVPTHLVLAIRHVYGRGIVRAALNATITGFLHLLVIAGLALAAMVVTILLG